MRVLINILFCIVAFHAFAAPPTNTAVVVPEGMTISEVVSYVTNEVPLVARTTYECKTHGVIYVDSNESPGTGALVYKAKDGVSILVRKSNINECMT